VRRCAGHHQRWSFAQQGGYPALKHLVSQRLTFLPASFVFGFSWRGGADTLVYPSSHFRSFPAIALPQRYTHAEFILSFELPLRTTSVPLFQPTSTTSAAGRDVNVVLAQCSRGVSRCVVFPSYPPFYSTDLVRRSLADACPCAALTCLSLQTARCAKGDVCDFTLARRPRRCAIALASVFGAQLVVRARCAIISVPVPVEPLAWQGARAHETRDAGAGRSTHGVARNAAGPGPRQPCVS
jgi:hypothetical protein